MSFKSQSIDFVSYQSGDGSLVIDLSNDTGIIVTDENGEGGIYRENAATTPIITEGTSDISGQFTWSAYSDDDDLIYTFDSSTRKCQVTDLKKDSGTVMFTAQHNETNLIMSKSFKVSKLKAGSAGTSYWVSSSLGSIAKRQDGTFRDGSITFTAKTKSKEDGIQKYKTKLEIFVDNESTAIAITETGECTVYLGIKPENDNSQNIYCIPGIKLTCRMHFVKSSNPPEYYPSVYDEEGISVIWDGENGQDGTLVEYCYLLTDTETEFGEEKTPIPYWQISEGNPPQLILPEAEDKTWKWTDNPVGISESHKYEYMTKSTRENNAWSDFIYPVIWSRWGDKGKDGDGIEYRFCQMPDDTVQPEYPAPENATYEWTDEPRGVGLELRCEYVVLLKVSTDENGEPVYTPTKDEDGKTYGKLWSRWGEDGTSVSIKASADECVELGHGYINEEGNLMVLTSIDPREFTDAGEIRGPQGETVYFHVAYANSADGSQDFSVSDYIDKSYIGHYTDTTEEDSLDYRSYKWMRQKGDQGDSGPKGPTIEQVKIYQTNNSTTVSTPEGNAPNLPTGWSLIPATMSPDTPYVWKSEGQKITTYSAADGSVETENYSNTWTTPELYAAGLYDADKKLIKTSQDYLTFLKLTNFGDQECIKGDDEGNLYINASFIKTGALMIGSKTDAIFYADIGTQEVTIGGFSIGKYGLGDFVPQPALVYGLTKELDQGEGVYIYELTDSSFVIAPTGIEAPQGHLGVDKYWKMLVGENFGVTSKGEVYAQNMVARNTLYVEANLDLNKAASSATSRGQIGRIQSPATFKLPSQNVKIGLSFNTLYLTLSNMNNLALVGASDDCIKIFVTDSSGNSETLTIPFSDFEYSAGGLVNGIQTDTYEFKDTFNYTQASLQDQDITVRRLYADFEFGGGILPTESFTYSLGDPSHVWDRGHINRIYSDHVFTTSDKNKKNHTGELQECEDAFYDLINPVIYSLKNDPKNSYHFGFYAQEIEELLTQTFPKLNNGIVNKGLEGYSLNYSEFIALNTWQIQKLKPRVQQLEEKIILLEQRIIELEGKI